MRRFIGIRRHEDHYRLWEHALLPDGPSTKVDITEEAWAWGQALLAHQNDPGAVAP